MRTRALALTLWSCCSCSWLVVFLAGFPSAACARDDGGETGERRDAIAALLARRVIPAELPLREVQAFTEVRVPILPVFDAAATWEAYAAELREAILEDIVLRGEAAAWNEAEAGIEWLETIEGGPGYRIRKLRFEAVPGLWVPALLYEPLELEGKVPVVLNVNGHDGKGKAAPYKQLRCINQAKRGMIALNVEWIGMGQLRHENFTHYRMNQLDLCGTSGLAPFYLSMKRSLDLLLRHEHADANRVAVAGLSGGGWQTIVISALDTRVTLSNPVAGYSSFRTRARVLKDLGDSEQTPSDLATLADYTHLTALRAPRPTLLTYNAKDNCCFEAGISLPPLIESARPIFALFDAEDRLHQHINEDPGTHNFEIDNRQALYRVLDAHFYAGEPDRDATEIPSESEIRTAEELHVELPATNADFNSLALALAQDLPRRPTSRTESHRREELRSILAFRRLGVEARNVGEAERAGVRARYWRLRLGDAWTVPAVELTKVGQNVSDTVLIVSEHGRRSEFVAEAAEKSLESNRRVLALDPFYLGESKISSRDFLYALLVACVGDRPLGIQASQLAAIARWTKARNDTGPVTVVAHGPRSSLFSLAAAAASPHGDSHADSFGRLELHGALRSLKEILEKNWTVRERPELFCFGLLESFDVEDLVALAGEVEFGG